MDFVVDCIVIICFGILVCLGVTIICGYEFVEYFKCIDSRYEEIKQEYTVSEEMCLKTIRDMHLELDEKISEVNRLQAENQKMFDELSNMFDEKKKL